LARETNEEPTISDATGEGTQGALPASPSYDVAMASVRDFKSMKVIRRLGNGSFGVVALVEDPETHKSIALKSIKLKEASAAQSFLDFISEVTQLI
jgi:serine/threonine protein kinase